MEQKQFRRQLIIKHTLLKMQKPKQPIIPKFSSCHLESRAKTSFSFCPSFFPNAMGRSPEHQAFYCVWFRVHLFTCRGTQAFV